MVMTKTQTCAYNYSDLSVHDKAEFLQSDHGTKEASFDNQNVDKAFFENTWDSMTHTPRHYLTFSQHRMLW